MRTRTITSNYASHIDEQIAAAVQAEGRDPDELHLSGEPGNNEGWPTIIVLLVWREPRLDVQPKSPGAGVAAATVAGVPYVPPVQGWPGGTHGT
jgi:hypothetical protein